jgi:hypothetical protein
MTQCICRALAGSGLILALGMGSEACAERGSTTGSASAASSGPAMRPAEDRREADAVAMATALRSYYPLAREAQENAATFRGCGADINLTEWNKCRAEYLASLNELKGRLPSDADVSGCALVVVGAVRRTLDVAIQSANPNPDETPGPRMTPLHEALGECTNRLFRFGSVSCRHGTARILEPLELLGQLGLRDDELPGPTTFNKPRGGHVCLATERELDRATLAIK